MVDRLGFVVAPGTNAPASTVEKVSVTVEPDPLKGGDVYQWAMDQAALIRARRYDEIDWINVADEIESVGKSEFRSLVSNVEIVLIHMLKWDYQPLKRSRSWRHSISEHRQRIQIDLDDNPSLKARQQDAIIQGHRLARYAAARQTGLRLRTFPDSCPYDWDAIMTSQFVLDQTDELP